MHFSRSCVIDDMGKTKVGSLTLTPGGYAAEKQIPISLTLTPGGYAAEKQIPISNKIPARAGCPCSKIRLGSEEL
jgi:hypothetical protein